MKKMIMKLLLGLTELDHHQYFFFVFVMTSLFLTSIYTTPKLCSAESDDSIYFKCDTTIIFNSTSDPEVISNLDDLFKYLRANVSGNKGFASYNVGTAFGEAFCRGDVSPSDCNDCIDYVTNTNVGCRNYVYGAQVYRNFCQMQYAIYNVIGNENHDDMKCIPGGDNFTNPSLLHDMRSSLLRNLSSTALATTHGNATTVPWFASGWTRLTELENIYAYVQCSRDIRSTDCMGCLQFVIVNILNCCNNSESCRFMTPSCIIRYENFNFLNNGSIAVEVFNATSTAGTSGASNSSSRLVMIVGSCVGAAVIIILIGILVFVIRKKGSNKPGVYSLEKIRAATDNFSRKNIVGEGGFGCVYKGKFPGEEVAVKRLSKSSNQGETEFRKEVDLMATFRHKYLLQIKGYCIEKGEKILVYNYMENNNLATFLFDKEKKEQLTWNIRLNIIRGIAQGLSYLHWGVEPAVIHRDLKLSNILLDKELQPKIADFGLVKLLGSRLTEDTTREVAGTRGYMAPEAKSHKISKKLDVFSFGVMIFEIITGLQNNSNQFKPLHNHIASYVWQLWSETRVMDLLDDSVKDSEPKLDKQVLVSQVTSCIHVGLLCVQEEEDMRPDMKSVCNMLDNMTTVYPMPKPPPIFSAMGHDQGPHHSNIDVSSSAPAPSTSNSHVNVVEEEEVTEVQPTWVTRS